VIALVIIAIAITGAFVVYIRCIDVAHQFTPHRNKVLIIPIEFNDLTFSDFNSDLELFTKKLVASDYHDYSVVDYYKKESFGKLNLSFEVIYRDDNGTLSPFKINNNCTAYSSDKPNLQNSSDAVDYADEGYFQLTKDVLTILLQLIKNNSSEIRGLTFTPNQNTTIILLHPTQPQELTKNGSDFWSKAFNTKFGDFGSISVVLLSFNSSSGVIIHELGHSLGLVDLYDVDNNYEWHFTPMATSENLPNTSDFLAMEKLWLGWINSSEVLTINKGDSINNTYLYPSNWDFSIANKTIKIIVNESSYYILETRGDNQYRWHLFIYSVDETKLEHENQRILGKDIIKFFYSVYLPILGFEHEYYDPERMISIKESSEVIFFHDYENGIFARITYLNNCAYINQLNFTG